MENQNCETNPHILQLVSPPVWRIYSEHCLPDEGGFFDAFGKATRTSNVFIDLIFQIQVLMRLAPSDLSSGLSFGTCGELSRLIGTHRYRSGTSDRRFPRWSFVYASACLASETDLHTFLRTLSAVGCR